MKVIIIGALPASLINFRKDLIKLIVKRGHKVIAMASGANCSEIAEIESLGVKYIDYMVQRNGLNPFADIKTLLSFISIFKIEKPDIVIAYTIKPVIWGGIAARFIPNLNFFGLITGLGFAFQNGDYKRNFLSFITKKLYRLALSQATKVIFQNPDNMQSFIVNSITTKNQAENVHGSGVNLEYYKRCDLPQSTPVFLTIARLLGEKGLREFEEAARIVKSKYPEVIFQILGPEDSSLDAIPIAEVNEWHRSGRLDYLGASNDVRPFIAKCSVFVLASYHEGMPRTVLEAMAMGRPILTTNVAGCKETVNSGENGFLVEKGDVADLANKMLWFIENRVKWQEMADKSFELAKDRYDVHKVNQSLINILELE
jgi:glycosyltransferase involved in cell wall biosynthesis